jgi:hypothetical protein
VKTERKYIISNVRLHSFKKGENSVFLTKNNKLKNLKETTTHLDHLISQVFGQTLWYISIFIKKLFPDEIITITSSVVFQSQAVLLRFYYDVIYLLTIHSSL